MTQQQKRVHQRRTFERQGVGVGGVMLSLLPAPEGLR